MKKSKLLLCLLLSFALTFLLSSCNKKSKDKSETTNKNNPSTTNKYNPVTTNKDNEVLYGKYQDEDIIWIVLEKKDGKALLLSKYILDAKSFDSTSNNYENSEIRNWLNTSFYNDSFSQMEKERILEVELDNSKESTAFPISNQYACSNTLDKVFLLSYSEVLSYFPDDESKIAHYTTYAKNNGLWINQNTDAGNWWLRSPYSSNPKWASSITADKGNAYDVSVTNSDYGIRPAIWLDI